MLNRTLWRIERVNDGAERDVAALTAGLRLHVVHSPPLTVVMQIGEKQRCYVLLEGCAGCADDRCRAGCPAALLRRLIASQDLGLTLRAVAPPQGLARRSYTRGALGCPGPGSQPLDSALLTPWADARLAVYWRRYGSAICTSALLFAGATRRAPKPRLARLRRTGVVASALAAGCPSACASVRRTLSSATVPAAARVGGG
jgi:hypothetical protein